MDSQDRLDLDRIERRFAEEELEYFGAIYADVIPVSAYPLSYEAMQKAREDIERAVEHGRFSKDCIERGDEDGARSCAKLAAHHGGRVSERQLQEIKRLDLERKIDSCVYQIEHSRCQARGLEKDARDAEKHGDFEAAKTLSHAAVLEWRRVELYQEKLLDLTRE